MPDINLPHADLNKCNQTPNHLANHLKEILYTYTCDISRRPLKVCEQKTENIYFDFDFNFA